MNDPQTKPIDSSLDDLEIEDKTSEEALALLGTHVVRAVNVKKTFHLGESQVHALRGVDLAVRRGEYVSIMGPSGSGKSTLFNMIGGLDKPDEGRIYIDEVNIAEVDIYELAWLRCHKIGYIFQTFNLIQVASALENVMFPMLFAGENQADARDKAALLLQKVGLGSRLHHKPVEMSGGQQQRVAIARSLANDPAILLADEPTGNLDLKTGEEIVQVFCDLRDTFGVTIITATHDYKMLSKSDRVIWLEDGLVKEIKDRSQMDIQEGGLKTSD